MPGRSWTRPRHRRWAGLACGLLLAALAVTLRPAEPRGQPRAYVVDPLASQVRILLFRKGLFAPLAHDHVLVAAGFAGRVQVDPAAVGTASLQLSFPVASLRVDPPEVRRELELSGSLDEEDRAEVRAAMLAPDQLHAGEYPRVVATLEGVTGALPEVTLTLRVRIRGAERTLEVPATVELGAARLRARGTFELVQSAFGIEPYSTLLGAIAVKDVVRVRYEIVAERER